MNFYGTNKHKRYWIERKINWKKEYQSTADHPHRDLIISALSSFSWLSLLEIGVGGGANLVKILKNFSGKQLGGIDINSDAIELCERSFNSGFFKVGSADNIMMSDKSVDVILSDAVLIYTDWLKIGTYLREIRRIGRNHIVLCEFNEKKWINKIKFWLKTGYFAHNWPKILEKYGFYDIQVKKINEFDWPGGYPWSRFGAVIIAKIPKI